MMRKSIFKLFIGLMLFTAAPLTPVMAESVDDRVFGIGQGTSLDAFTVTSRFENGLYGIRWDKDYVGPFLQYYVVHKDGVGVCVVRATTPAYMIADNGVAVRQQFYSLVEDFTQQLGDAKVTDTAEDTLLPFVGGLREGAIIIGARWLDNPERLGRDVRDVLLKVEALTMSTAHFVLQVRYWNNRECH